MDRQTFEAELEARRLRRHDQHHAGREGEPRAQPSVRRAGDGAEGRADADRDGSSQTYKPGEIFTMPRGCLHSESYGPEGAVVLFGRKI